MWHRVGVTNQLITTVSTDYIEPVADSIMLQIIIDTFRKVIATYCDQFDQYHQYQYSEFEAIKQNS
jgi:predicted glycosyltransferase involved in capsule biosynthesis